jgi:hypothetical protein
MRNYRQHLALLMLVMGLTGCAATQPQYAPIVATNAANYTAPNPTYLFATAGHRYVIDKADPGFTYHSDDENVVRVTVENGDIVAYTVNPGKAYVNAVTDSEVEEALEYVKEFVFAVRKED